MTPGRGGCCNKVLSPGFTLRTVLAAAIVASLAQAPARAQASVKDPLAKARSFYNLGQFDQAIEMADEARHLPKLANAAAIVLARAHLERFRVAVPRGEQAPVDLAAARDALKLVEVAVLAPRDRVEFFTGLGESLYLDGDQPDGPPLYGAAAELFDRAMTEAATSSPDAREPLFEWWAASIDRGAQLVTDTERRALYTRLVLRAERELEARPDSASALYWIAAGARGMDNVNRAWDAAVAAWIRAPQLGAGATHLRDDLDRLMTKAILPERARLMTAGGDARTLEVVLLAEWETLKQRWQK